ncbi:MAG: glycosyltransferase family 4 protein [Deltaproteobacteria bacterium]|nr:glycosyltransferase family 4 protein [Deltaproteobacteria bacterium]
MRIGLVGRVLQYDGYGVKTHSLELLRALCRIDHSHQLILFTTPEQDLSELPIDPRLKTVSLYPRTQNPLLRLVWSHFSVGIGCWREDIDVLFVPGHVKPLLIPCPSVVVVYDMMYHLFPSQWSWTERLYFQLGVSLLTKRAKQIIAISKSTSADLVRLVGVDPGKVRVIYPGVSNIYRECQEEARELLHQHYKIYKPFILSVGSFHPRKQAASIIKAFETIASRIDHELILIGPGQWEEDRIRAAIAGSAFADRIRFLGLVPEKHLPYFYSAASVFVFPSIYEGFGLPVLEALACGAPVITTSSSSLPEVAGASAIFVSPYDFRDFGEKIFEVLSNVELRQTLKERALEQAEKFSWEKSARETLALLEEAVNVTVSDR